MRTLTSTRMRQALRVENIVDTGVENNDLVQYFEQSGYWNTPERKMRHSCVLSPCAYVIRRGQSDQLNHMARSVYAAVQGLEDLLRELARKRAVSNGEARFLKLARGASHGLPKPGEHAANDIPPIVKVDMVEDAQGIYRVVEIDAYNPRALGTMALLDGIWSPYISISSKRTLDVAKGLRDIMSRMGAAGGEQQWDFLLPEHERYYQAAYEVLRTRVEGAGTQTRLVWESEAAANPRSIVDAGSIPHLFLIPERMDRYPEVRSRLCADYRRGEVKLIYPPKPYLGCKAFLPWLARQPGMNEIIPATAVLQGNSHGQLDFSSLPTSEVMVLKPANSSGAKHIIFSDADPTQFSAICKAEIGRRTPEWIVQEQVEQHPVPLIVFDDRRGEIVRPYYFRFTAYITCRGLLGMKATARPGRLVHGAPDCAHIPALFDK